MTDLSIITATRDRPGLLWQCCEHVRRQSHKGIAVEHIVVSDGENADARRIARLFDALYYFHPRPGEWDGGNRCRDLGIANAHGRYLIFWDDDNVYHAHAAATQYAAAYGHGIGLTQVWHRQLQCEIPEVPFTAPALGHVDTACLCVRRELARVADWSHSGRGDCGDWYWLEKILPRAGEFGGLRFVPVITAAHL